MSENEEDISLIERFKQGDEAALEALISRHHEGLFRFIYWHLQDEHEASDVLSQTFFKAYHKRDRYRPKPGVQFQTWLYTIATNLCRDHLRKRRRRPGDFAAVSGEPGPLEGSAGTSAEAGPDELAAQAEDIAMLRQVIASLPSSLRDALVLSVLEGRTQKETAELLGCTVRAVEARIRRAKELIRLEMSKAE